MGILARLLGCNELVDAKMREPDLNSVFQNLPHCVIEDYRHGMKVRHLLTTIGISKSFGPNPTYTTGKVNPVANFSKPL